MSDLLKVFRRSAYLACAYPKYVLTGRALKFPLVLQIQTQSYCNGHCIFCPYDEISRILPQGKMDWDLFTKIVMEITSNLFPSAVIFELHNEPLLDERTFQFIKYIKSINPRKRTAIVTNGTLINKFSVSEIIDSQVNGINISLNAYSSTIYEKLTGGMDYSAVKESISLLSSDPRLKRKLTITFVETILNQDEIKVALQYWKDKGIRTRVLQLMNRAGMLDSYNLLKSNSYKTNGTLPKRLHYLQTKAKQTIGCYHPFYKLNILYNGDAILCCHDWKRATVIGNINNSSIQEIWNSQELNKIRGLLLANKLEQLPSCRNCSIIS